MDADSQALAQLIEAAARGDHAAFARIYERTHAHLFGVAIRMLGREQAAEDVLQEAFVSIWKSAGTYRAEVAGQRLQPMTWLIAIVRNKALDALRARTRRNETPLAHEAEGEDGTPSEIDGLPAAPSALDLFTQATQAAGIAACMEVLDGSHRQSLALAYYHGLSHSEVAERMGAPLGSVKAWIRRGLEKLKDCLGRQGAAR